MKAEDADALIVAVARATLNETLNSTSFEVRKNIVDVYQDLAQEGLIESAEYMEVLEAYNTDLGRHLLESLVESLEAEIFPPLPPNFALVEFLIQQRKANQ